MGGKLQVRIAVHWKGGLLGGAYQTLIAWEFDQSQTRATVLADNATVAVAPKNASQLDEYFRDEVYAKLNF